MKKHNQLSRLLLLSIVSASLFAGCGGNVPAVTDAGSGGTPAAQPDLTSPGGFESPVGGYDSTLPQPLPPDAAPQEPLDTPEPLPAPSTPVQPGQPMILRAVANTTAFAVPRFSKWFQINGVYVYNHLTWQPVNGAAEYWIYKDRLPEFGEARRDTAHAIVNAGFARSGYKDGLEPPNLKTGSVWDRLKRAIGTITNRPGVTYTYKVIAADANGVPMAESPVSTTVPLPAISSATMDAASDVNTVNPLFTWQDAKQGTMPDGYYVSVFPSVQFTGESLPPTALAYWSTFRPTGTNVARYGEDIANLSSYKSTRPFDISFDLQPSKNYSWTVVGIKTDTGDMKTANAISRSWSGFGHFQIAANATMPAPRPVTSQNVGSYNAPRYNQPAYGQTTYNSQNAYAQQYPQQQAYGQTTYNSQNAYAQQYGQTYPQQQAYPQQQQQQYPQQQYPQQQQQRAPQQQPTVSGPRF